MAKVLTIRKYDVCAEVLLIMMACFAPWAYGSVDASSEYIIYAVLLVVIGLRTIADWREGEQSLGSGPLYWALLGIIAIALLQAVPLSEPIIRAISPGTIQSRLATMPSVLETVRGDTLPPIAPAPLTISLDPNETWHGLVRLTAIFLLFDCASRSRLRFSTFAWFAKALIVNSTLLTAFALAQAFTWNGSIYWIRETIHESAWGTVGGPFFCHNHLAAYLNIGLGLSLGFFFANLDQRKNRGRAQLRRFFLMYSSGLIALGVLGSQSLGGVIATIVSLMVVFAISRMRPSTILPAFGAFLVLSILFVIAIGTVSPLLGLRGFTEFLATLLNGRPEVWGSAFETWKSYPVLGTGFGTYAETTSPNYNPIEKVFFGKFAAHGESEYMEMLVEGGLVGIGLLLVVVFDVLRRALAAFRYAPKKFQPVVLGSLFGLSTIITQSLTDFPLHIAGVTVPAVILASKLYRLGLWKQETDEDAEANIKGALSMSRRLMVAIKNVALLTTAGILIFYQASQVKLERLVEQALIPLPGTRWVTADIPSYPKIELEIMRTALTKALEIRPNWSEGHERLGSVLLGLYRHAAADALRIDLVTYQPDNKVESNDIDAEVSDEMPQPDSDGEIEGGNGTTPSFNGSTAGERSSSSDSFSTGRFSGSTNGSTRFDSGSTRFDSGSTRFDSSSNASKSSSKSNSANQTADPNEVARIAMQAEPLWVRQVVMSLKAKNPKKARQVLAYEPFQEFLIPAARSFLEARRSCSLLAVPHLQLAGLDYLLETEEKTVEYVKRGIALKGNHPRMLLLGAQLALDQKDVDLAIRYWHDYLKQKPRDCTTIAASLSAVLTPDQILKVARGGGIKTMVPMCVRLYCDPLSLIYRVRFMKAALAELPDDPDLDSDERIWYEGRIRGELAQYDAARQLMRKAIDSQPRNEVWRLEYIHVLMEWECYEEAYRLALRGARYFPSNRQYRKLGKSSMAAAVESGIPRRQLTARGNKFDR